MDLGEIQLQSYWAKKLEHISGQFEPTVVRYNLIDRKNAQIIISVPRFEFEELSVEVRNSILWIKGEKFDEESNQPKSYENYFENRHRLAEKVDVLGATLKIGGKLHGNILKKNLYVDVYSDCLGVAENRKIGILIVK